MTKDKKKKAGNRSEAVKRPPTIPHGQAKGPNSKAEKPHARKLPMRAKPHS